MIFLRLTLAAVFALVLTATELGHAQDRTIRFIRVVDTDTPIAPGSAATFSIFAPPSIDRGNVAFFAQDSAGGAGIYAWIDGQLTKIADRTTVLPNSNRLIQDFGQFPSVDDDKVTFAAANRARPAGVYMSDGTSIEVVADSTTLAPPRLSETFVNFDGIPTTDDGTTAFIAFSFGDQFANLGVYKRTPDGTIERVADIGTPIPDSSLVFGCPTPFCGGPTAFQTVFTDDGNVLFNGLGGTNGTAELGGLFTHIDGELGRVLAPGATIPGTSFPIVSIGLGSSQRGVLSGEDIAFVANSTAVVARIGGEFQTIVLSSQDRPGGGGQFERFAGLAIDNANIVFANQRSVIPTDGIFLKLANEDDVIKIINANDTLDGKEIDFFRLGPESINGHEIAFAVDFEDGSRGVYIASFGNQVPVADAGMDRFAQCTDLNGALVTLDGSGSTDPEGDPLTYVWRNSFGEARGVQPTVRLPFGENTITLVVDDGQLVSAPATVRITVADTTPPGIIASLTSLRDEDDDDDEGRFQIGFVASDTCDPAPTVTAALELPGAADISVVNGQIIQFESDDDGTEVESEDGILEIEAQSLILRATSNDAEGNTSMAEVRLAGGNASDNDD